MNNAKKKILIVDDSELNRSLLSDMLSDSFEIVEAENGMEAMTILHEQELEICLMLLDIVMPIMDGFEVLAMMNQKGWIKTIPVIMISAETGGAYIDRAYDLGAIDYISRPFDERTVMHRVTSNFMLTVKQKEMSEMLSEQIYEKEKDNSLMIEILSHIVEFRNGESGLHVLHVHAITDMLLEQLVKKTDKYPLSAQERRLIGNASALHDIGKISIPSEVLNKPGRFTPEEFEIMKGHTIEGANMLSAIPFRGNESLIQLGYQICRWHHERYDGKGYPDGLKGDEIPIAAQVVAMADVYDALTSERVYKPAYTPEQAMHMILNGECGVFNPLLLDCLRDISGKLKEELNVISFGHVTESGIRDTVERTLKSGGQDVSNRSIRLLERERMKFKFLADISGEIMFEYSDVPQMISLSEWGSETLGMPVKIVDPATNAQWLNIFPEKDFADFTEGVKRTTPENPVFNRKYLLTIGGEKRWCKVIAKVMWGDSEAPEFDGAIGKIVDINDETVSMQSLERKAEHDSRTGLFNHNAAKKRISAALAEGKGKHYALAVFDLDNFKSANDVYGHLFGDEILETVANRIRENIRSTDIAARMGGDEFILFMEYKDSVEPQIKRIFERLTKRHKDFDVSVSMGIACTKDCKEDYDTLFTMADTAMYTVKRESKNSYCFYNPTMTTVLRGEE
ncbi:MAG: diguanylate cyclase [Clostridia bacterium]|nr:diguanylate cyclase [Clostridia bacterium]